MKKILIITAALLLNALTYLQAQQTYMFTQYYFNPFLINPAIAGTNNYYQIRANNRFQWVGFGDGPVTNALSVYGPSGNKKYNMGFGGNVVSDITGPVSSIAANVSYGYNIAITSEMRLSGGLSVGINQYKLDGTQVTMPVALDVALPNTVNAKVKPDASAGLYLYSSNFNIGFAANQLFNSKLNKNVNSDDAFNRLKTHFFLTAFYKYFINKDFQLEPGVIFKQVRPAPLQVDITCRVIYRNMLSGGIAFRTKDAFSIMIGYIYDNKLSIAYAYDIGINAMRKYNYGSHEIMLAYRFNPIK